MKSVLYLHGFASSPASAKIAALRPMLAPQEIVLNTPDLNVPSFEKLDFEAIVAHAVAAGTEEPPRAIVGSSLGALIALATAKRIGVPLVLIAPAIGVANEWADRIPAGDPVIMFNFARNQNAPIHRAFFDQMAALDVDTDPPPARVTVLMGRSDQTIPFHIVEETWQRWECSGRLAEGSHLIAIDGGDHSLVDHAGLIRDAIVDAVA